MKLKALMTTLGLTATLATTQAIGLANQEFQKAQADLGQPQNNEAQESLLAFNFPDVFIHANVENDILKVTVSRDAVHTALDSVLRANEGRIKSTEFQRLNISGMRAHLVKENFDGCGSGPCIRSLASSELYVGVRIEGDFRFQFREKLGCTIRCHYTPWTSIGGKFSQPMYITEVSPSGDLQVVGGGTRLEGNNFLEEFVINTVAPAIGQKVHTNLRGPMSEVYNPRKILLDESSKALETLSNNSGMDLSRASQLIEQNLGNLSLDVVNGNLVFRLPVAQTFPVGGVYFTDRSTTFFSEDGTWHCAFDTPGQYIIHQNAFPVQANAGIQSPSKYGRFNGTCGVPPVYFGREDGATFFSENGETHCVFQSPQDYQQHQTRNSNRTILNLGLQDASQFGGFIGACSI